VPFTKEQTEEMKIIIKQTFREIVKNLWEDHWDKTRQELSGYVHEDIGEDLAQEIFSSIEKGMSDVRFKY